MLTTLNDLDHDQARAAQLSLCIKALAPTESRRVRYATVQVLGRMEDPRATALLRQAMTNDPDHEVRRAAAVLLRQRAEDGAR